MNFSPLGLTPLIGVWDMPTALAFYRDLLGFSVVAASPEVETAEGRFSHWMLLRFGKAEIMLCQGAQGGRGKGDNSTTFTHDGDETMDKGVWMSIWVDDLDAVNGLLDRVEARGRRPRGGFHAAPCAGGENHTKRSAKEQLHRASMARRFRRPVVSPARGGVDWRCATAKTCVGRHCRRTRTGRRARS